MLEGEPDVEVIHGATQLGGQPAEGVRARGAPPYLVATVSMAWATLGFTGGSESRLNRIDSNSLAGAVIPEIPGHAPGLLFPREASSHSR
jgi:hypothetical protein